MTIRMKVLATSLGVTVAAMVLLGILMFLAHRETYREEAVLRARAFLSMLSVAVVEPLSLGRIEAIDSMLGTLLEQNLKELDIRFVVVLDTDRRVVGHTDPSQYGRKMTGGFFELAAIADEPLKSEEADTLLVSSPVETEVRGQPGIRWGTVVAGVGLERVREGLLTLLVKAFFMVLGVTLLAATIMTWRLEGQVLRPVRRLTEATKAFASGDMKARAAVTADDEIGVLGTTFNQMAERLADHTDRLEAEIRARTRELEEANRRLEALAVTDGLTGLFNRRRFEEALVLEVQRAQRFRMPVSLLMMDVDHFKHYNDNHGHQAGDEVLRTIASHIKARVRSTDIACRYGGEEFAVVLPGTSGKDAMVLAERLRAIVEAHPFEKEETQPLGRLTISIGVACYPDDAKDPEGLVRAADQALYHAKQKGRNRVEAAWQR